MAYQIKKGDTLSKIASQYGTTVDEIYSLNKSNPSVKSKDLIILGGQLELPGATQAKPYPPRDAQGGTTYAPGVYGSAMPPAAGVETKPIVPPQDTSGTDTGGAGGAGASDEGGLPAVSETSVPSNDWSFSANSYLKSMMDIQAELGTLGTYKPTQEELDAHAAGDRRIISDSARLKEEVTDVAKAGELKQRRAGELLGLSPAASKYAIETFQTESDNFVKSIARSLEKINEEKQTALINGDYQFANQLAQEEKSLRDSQRTAIQDRMTFMTNAFNMMLSVKQEGRLDKQDAMTQIENMYKLGSIPTQASWTAAGLKGKPPATLPTLDTVKWGTPYEMDGKMVQRNSNTGEIKVLSLPYDATLTEAEKERYINNWVESMKTNLGTMPSGVPSEYKNEVNARYKEFEANKKALRADEPTTVDKILDWLGVGSSKTSTQSNSGSTKFSSALSSEMATNLDSIQQ